MLYDEVMVSELFWLIIINKYLLQSAPEDLNLWPCSKTKLSLLNNNEHYEKVHRHCLMVNKVSLFEHYY